MKKTKSILISVTLIILCLLLVLQATSSSIGQVGAYNAGKNKIKVIGSSEVCVKPDTAVINVGVETLNSSLTTAQKNNTEAMANVLKALEEHNIDKENIQTKNYFVREKYDYSKGQEFMGYQVSNFIEVKTNNLDGLSDLLPVLTENGANAFNGITFTLSDSTSAYNDALKKAIENAQSKLETLNVDNSNYKICEITEEYSYNCATNYANYDMLRNAAETSKNIEQGEVCIRAQVKVVFEAINGSENIINNNNETDELYNINKETGETDKVNKETGKPENSVDNTTSNENVNINARNNENEVMNNLTNNTEKENYPVTLPSNTNQEINNNMVTAPKPVTTENSQILNGFDIDPNFSVNANQSMEQNNVA